MKVRMKVSLSGTRPDGRRWPAAGETWDVDDGYGADLCSQGYAEPVATKPDEKTEKRPAKKRSEKRSK